MSTDHSAEPENLGKLHASKTASTDSYDVFLATPMSSIVEDVDYAVHRNGIIHIMKVLKEECRVESVYFAGTAINSKKDFTPENLALQEDLVALSKSKLFFLIYPEKVVSSALVEAGFAIALKKPSLIFAKKRSDLPYLLVEAGGETNNPFLPPIIVEEYSTIVDLGNKLCGLRSELDKLLQKA